ncbi:WD40 repeat-like protein [Amylocystis lapponica]|nr:WD40 repeat-like protein [Amylocystis lapponica]
MTEGTTVSVHRCRFGKKNAANRKALKYGMLAVGRANGNIELCEWTGTEGQVQAPQAWVVRKTLAGPNPSKADSIAFSIRFPDQTAEDEVPSSENLRLFSAGGGSELVEWDIEKCCIRRTISSQGGSIWAVVPNPASTVLALGCEDGAVRLLSIEGDGLTHLRRLDRAKSRILSIAWGLPVPRQTAKDQSQPDSDEDSDDEENDWTDSWLVTGCSDSSLRKWDIATGRVLDRMGTDKIRGERTLVWAVGVLGDGTIVSGDSMGLVKFWDPHTCTQLESFQGHAADVLCMTISPEGTAVYTSGVDQKVTQFAHVQTTRASDGPLSARASARWVQTSSRRLHSHDVRALAIWPPHTALPAAHRRTYPADIAPVLLSGGLDMSVVTTPAALAPSTAAARVTNPLATSAAATFEEAYHRRLAYCAGPCSAPAVHLARAARLLLCMRDAGVSVWRILPKAGAALQDCAGEDGGWERVLDMELSVRTNLVASAISDDGRWIAVSDWYETKVFRLEAGVPEAGGLKPRRVRGLTAVLQAHLPGRPASTGASVLGFTPDASKLILGLDLGTDAHGPHVLRKFEQHRVPQGLTGPGAQGAQGPAAHRRPGTEEEDAQDDSDTIGDSSPLSADGQWLATSDDRSRTHIFNLDSVQHHTALPSFPQPVHALAFDPAHPHTLVLGFATNSIQVYDVEARQFPRWARALAHALPSHFTQLHDPLLGAAFDPPPRGRVRAPGAVLGRDVAVQGAARRGGKRRRERPQEGADAQRVRVVTHYRPLLLVDYVAPGELVVVERPLVDVLAKLPPAYFKTKYGAS